MVLALARFCALGARAFGSSFVFGVGAFVCVLAWALLG